MKLTSAVNIMILVHIVIVALLLIFPEQWLMLLIIIISNHIILALTLAGILPCYNLLGENITHLSDTTCERQEIAITIDDGPCPLVTPLVLDILDKQNAKATFFCIGRNAEKHPQLCREIINRGHQIENHSYTHSYLFAFFTAKKIHDDINKAQKILKQIVGSSNQPRFFRPAAGIRNPFMNPVLKQLNLRLVGWTRRGFDTKTSISDKIYNRLTENLQAGDILLLHDGNAAKTVDGKAVILEVLPRLLTTMKNQDIKAVSLNEGICKIN